MTILFFIAGISLSFFSCSLFPQAFHEYLKDNGKLQLEELRRQREQYQMRTEEVTQKFFNFKGMSQENYKHFQKEFMACQELCTIQAEDIKTLKEKIDKLETKQNREHDDSMSLGFDASPEQKRLWEDNLPLLRRHLEDTTQEVRKNLETLTIALQATKAGKEALRVVNKKLKKIISNNHTIIASQQFKIELLEKVNNRREAYVQAQENELQTTQQALTNAQDRIARTTLSIERFLNSPLGKRMTKQG